MRHGLRIGFTDVSRIDHDQRVHHHPPGRVLYDLLLYRASQSRCGQVTREPLFGLLQQDRLAQHVRHLTEFAVLTGRHPKQHLLQKLRLGFGKVGRKYPQKLVNLNAQFLGNSGSLHRWSPWLESLGE